MNNDTIIAFWATEGKITLPYEFFHLRSAVGT